MARRIIRRSFAQIVALTRFSSPTTEAKPKPRLTRGMLIGAAAFCMAVAGAADGLRAQSALDQTPSDSWVIIRVRNLQDLSQKVSNLAQQIGVAAAQPELADPLGAVMKQAHVNAGLNKSGDLEVAIVPVEDYGVKDPGLVHDQILPIILVPVSDYQAFLGNFTDVQTDNGISSFTAPDHGPKTYSAQWGNYAALAPVKDLLSKKPEGCKITGACAKEFDTKDVTVYANIALLSPQAQAGLRDLQKQVDDMFTKVTAGKKLPPNITPTEIAVAKVAIQRCFVGVDRLLDDTQAASFSINLDKDGIGTSLVYDFKPGSYMAGIVHGLKSPEQPHLVGLPDKPYLFYGASRTDSAAMNKLIDDILNPAIPDLQKAGVDTKRVEDFVGDLKTMDSATEDEVVGMLEPTGQFGKDSLVQTIMIGNGDAKTAVKAQRKVMDDENSFMTLFGQGTLQFTPNAKTVDDVQFDSWTVNAPEATSPEAKQMQMIIKLAYGPNGMTTDSGVVDDHHFITEQGLDDKTISDVIAAVKDGKDPLEKTDGFKLVSPHLPANAAGVFYLDLGNILTSVNEYARQFGVPLGLQVQPNLPPIGMAVAVDGDALRMDSFTPNDLIQSMVSTTMMMMMRMNQGGGPGGHGGL